MSLEHAQIPWATPSKNDVPPEELAPNNGRFGPLRRAGGGTCTARVSTLRHGPRAEAGFLSSSAPKLVRAWLITQPTLSEPTISELNLSAKPLFKTMKNPKR